MHNLAYQKKRKQKLFIFRIILIFLLLLGFVLFLIHLLFLSPLARENRKRAWGVEGQK